MSVPKRKRGVSKMQFVDTARELEAHALSVCARAPKRYTPFLTKGLMELASEVHNHVRAANNIVPANQHEAQMRRDHLIEGNNALQNLDPKLQLLYDGLLKNPEQHPWADRAMEEFGRLIAGEAKLIAAVKKSDRERYRNLPP